MKKHKPVVEHLEWDEQIGDIFMWKMVKIIMMKMEC